MKDYNEALKKWSEVKKLSKDAPYPTRGTGKFSTFFEAAKSLPKHNYEIVVEGYERMGLGDTFLLRYKNINLVQLLGKLNKIDNPKSEVDLADYFEDMISNVTEEFIIDTLEANNGDGDDYFHIVQDGVTIVGELIDINDEEEDDDEDWD